MVLTNDQSRQHRPKDSKNHDRAQVLEEVSLVQIVATFEYDGRQNEQEKGGWGKGFLLLPTVTFG